MVRAYTIGPEMGGEMPRWCTHFFRTRRIAYHHGVEAPRLFFDRTRSHGAAYFSPWMNNMLWVCFAKYTKTSFLRPSSAVIGLFSPETFRSCRGRFSPFAAFRTKKKLCFDAPGDFWLPSSFSGTFFLSCSLDTLIPARVDLAARSVFLPCEAHASES